MSDIAAAEELREVCGALRDEVGRVIVGQTAVVDALTLALLVGGHTLLIGVPGLAKTLLVSTLARALDLDFRRIQFTPDLMPTDITGTEVIEEDRASGSRSFRFVRGPIFANVLLADEINRTPPKTQAALLESMEEKSVTIAGTRHPLPNPFFVLATQNPIEQEGTYPLPEAQLDRFTFNLLVDYPDREEEREIVRRTTVDAEETIRPVLDAERLIAARRLVRRVPVPETVLTEAVDIVARTRPASDDAPEVVRRTVSWGAGPRASQALILAAKGRALMQGRFAAEHEDIRAVAPDVLRHRIVISFAGEAEGVGAEDVIAAVVGGR